jgi:hypothetical protein
MHAERAISWPALCSIMRRIPRSSSNNTCRVLPKTRRASLAAVCATGSMHDHYWLYNTPQYANALRWSEDNLIAVAGAHTVVVVNPCDFGGPRAFTAEKQADNSAINPGCQPDTEECNSHFLIACLAETRSKDVLNKNAVRSIDWSPSGCTHAGGCLLAAVTSDHKVPRFTYAQHHRASYHVPATCVQPHTQLPA